MSIPNIITLGRILLVPVIIWAIASNQMQIAFAIFVIAGVSDAVDGFLAKRFNMASELGALLDPLADKALLVSIFVALGIWGAVPGWLVILVVSRDIMIVAAVIISWLFGKPDPDAAADGLQTQHRGTGRLRGSWCLPRSASASPPSPTTTFSWASSRCLRWFRSRSI